MYSKSYIPLERYKVDIISYYNVKLIIAKKSSLLDLSSKKKTFRLNNP